MKKFLGGLLALSMIASFSFISTAEAVTPTWNTTGSYNVDFTCDIGCSGTYGHDMDLTQDGTGNLTGSGGYPADGAHVYHWALTSGTVSGNTINFSADYTLGAIGTTMIVSGTVAGDGTMSGTWSDNYGGTRSGTWETTSGNATLITDTGLSFEVNPWVYDPGNVGGIVAEWRVIPSSTYSTLTDKDQCKKDGWRTFSPPFRNQGQCVSHVSNLAQELVLQKNVTTETNAAAGADITGEEGIILTSLGFDVKNETYCGAGAPRFNVYTTSGVYYFFGCTYGTHTDLGNGWTRITFDNLDAFPSDGTTVFPGFGSTTITDIEIVMDEQGATTLDNIMINGGTVGGM